MKDRQERKESITSRFDQVNSIGKVMSAPKRLDILIGLMEDARTFQDIKDLTNLEKSALSNHLKLLITQGLVEKKHHGIYGITFLGYQLIVKLDDLLDESATYAQNEQEIELRKQFTYSFLNRPKR